MIRTFFKLIRWPNLLIIALSMVCIRYFVILPGLHILSAGGMGSLSFALLVIATLFIAIGGYLINDIVDKEADEYNKPGKNQVDLIFSRKTVKILYRISTLLGVIAGTWLSIRVGRINFSLIFILTAGLLWFYSKRYKCQPLVGNIVVAFLSALSFGLVWLYEFVAVYHNTVHLEVFKNYFVLTNKLVLIYMGFAFLISLVREVLKDIEDYAGDNRFGCRTFAVVYGTGAAKTAAVVILIFGLLFSGWVQYLFYQSGLNTLLYYFFAIDILFIVNILRLLKAKEKSDYSLLATHLKILMAAGILSMLLCYFHLLYVG